MLGDLHLIETFGWVSLFKGLASSKSGTWRISASVVVGCLWEKPLILP